MIIKYLNSVTISFKIYYEEELNDKFGFNYVSV